MRLTLTLLVAFASAAQGMLPTAGAASCETSSIHGDGDPSFFLDLHAGTGCAGAVLRLGPGPCLQVDQGRTIPVGDLASVEYVSPNSCTHGAIVRFG